jgi:hydrogenase maturation factor
MVSAGRTRHAWEGDRLVLLHRPANEARWLLNARHRILNSNKLFLPYSAAIATDAATKMATGRAVNSKFEW